MKARPFSLKGKRGYIEVRAHEGQFRPCDAPNLIISMDVGYFILHPKHAMFQIMQEVGSALLGLFERDYSAYPKLGDKIAAAEAGVITPDGSIINPYTEKVIESGDSGE